MTKKDLRFILTAVLPVFLLMQVTAFAQNVATDNLKSFGAIGKQLSILTNDRETVLMQHKGRGALTHLWFGGSFEGYEQTVIRIYVDGETVPSIDMELFLGHGIGFNDAYAPWATDKMGKTGSPSGVYNTFRIPFGKEIKVTARLSASAPDKPQFWWIIRGTENLPVTLGGVQLPDGARLKLYKIENREFDALEEFDMCNVEGKGALFLVTIAAKGLRTPPHKDRWKDLSYMEACIRAYFDGGRDTLLLSSGLEDYFLGTYYFNKGRYYTSLAGLTHLDAETGEFSAYRFHDDDPLFFQNGFRLTNRVGETVGGNVVGEPPRTRYTTYVWLYQW
ncbi:MAG: DUF2961 domain-containing protein [Prevotellaceae bacterium]|jgi:hypothetical protein|nr:DUF2961 domain-containing protein [Prevotellaceae bacterium]